MSTLDKFAHVAALRPARKRQVPEFTVPEFTAPEITGEFPQETDRIGKLLGGRVRRNRYGEHLSVQQWYSTPEMCVPDARSLALLLPNTLYADDLLQTAANPEQWLFLDTETTGLAGGTGTYPFLVGLAWWDAGGLQVEQFFMRDLDEEHSLLLELATRMAERPVLVTFNGKSFDWPLIETRYRMTRCIDFCTPKVHLDFLHPARQLWRLRLGSVRLKDLERHVLARDGCALGWSRHDDIDSSLIPEMYFNYIRGGAAEPLAGVFRHNQMDLRGLAAVAGKIFKLLDSGHGIPSADHPEVHDPVDVFGLSRILHRRGHSTRARELYESALRTGLPRAVERLAKTELARLAKRELDYARAESLWHDLRKRPKSTKRSEVSSLRADAEKDLEAAIDAAEQLAIYYEHRVKEPHRAIELVRAAITELRGAQRSGGIKMTRGTKLEARLMQRLTRLERICVAAPVSEGLAPAVVKGHGA